MTLMSLSKGNLAQYFAGTVGQLIGGVCKPSFGARFFPVPCLMPYTAGIGQVAVAWFADRRLPTPAVIKSVQLLLWKVSFQTPPRLWFAALTIMQNPGHGLNFKNYTGKLLPYSQSSSP